MSLDHIFEPILDHGWVVIGLLVIGDWWIGDWWIGGLVIGDWWIGGLVTGGRVIGGAKIMAFFMLGEIKINGVGR